MTIVDIVVVGLAIVGVYHIIEEILCIQFEKENKQFLEDFKREYEKKNRK